MHSATLLASLLASAHGFAATPTGGVECSANEEKFFVYSFDLSLIYPFIASVGGLDVTSNVTVTHGLVGNTWQGLQLSITQGNTTITQAGGKPLTVTSPNTLDSGGFNVVSEDFCLGDGSWTLRMSRPTHPEMASYNATADKYLVRMGWASYNVPADLSLTMEDRLAPGAPINTVPVQPQAVVDWALEASNVDFNNFNGNGVVYTPFFIRWAIFPAEMRADAEAAAATGVFGMSFIGDNGDKAWAIGEVDYERAKVVPFVPCGPGNECGFGW